MIKVSKILTATALKVWLSPTGKVVNVPSGQEHADVARELFGPDYDPDYNEDAFTEALKAGWIRMGSGVQTYAMVGTLTKQALVQIQKFIMTHSEFNKIMFSLEQYEVSGGRNLSYYGTTEDFLMMNYPQDVFRKRVA